MSMPMQRPILLQNICKTDRWGGTNLQKMFGINSPFDKTSEVWTASAHEKGETCIINTNKEIPKSAKLSEIYVGTESRKIFGSNCLKYDKFPLLAKWIDANDNLSVQVHPDDEYAKNMSNPTENAKLGILFLQNPELKLFMV